MYIIPFMGTEKTKNISEKKIHNNFKGSLKYRIKYQKSRKSEKL